MRRSKCKYCEAEISYVKTTKGATMPVDIRPQLAVYVVVGEDDKEHLLSAKSIGLRAFVSHFATCPKVGKVKEDQAKRAEKDGDG